MPLSLLDLAYYYSKHCERFRPSGKPPHAYACEEAAGANYANTSHRHITRASSRDPAVPGGDSYLQQANNNNFLSTLLCRQHPQMANGVLTQQWVPSTPSTLLPDDSDDGPELNCRSKHNWLSNCRRIWQPYEPACAACPPAYRPRSDKKDASPRH